MVLAKTDTSRNAEILHQFTLKHSRQQHVDYIAYFSLKMVAVHYVTVSCDSVLSDTAMLGCPCELAWKLRLLTVMEPNQGTNMAANANLCLSNTCDPSLYTASIKRVIKKNAIMNYQRMFLYHCLALCCVLLHEKLQ